MSLLIKQHQAKKNPVLENIKALYHSIARMSSNRVEYAQRLSDFSTNIQEMIRVVCPDVQEAMSAVGAVFSKIVQCNAELAAKEERVSEDIRDLVERFSVVNRANENYMKQTENYANASNKLIDALAEELAQKEKVGYEKIRPKIEAAITKAKIEKNAQNKTLSQSISRLINLKEKYNQFKIRRLTHAFQLFSSALAEHSEKEARFYQELIEALDNVKNAIPQELNAAIKDATKPLDNENEKAAAQSINEIKESNDELPETPVEQPPEEEN